MTKKTAVQIFGKGVPGYRSELSDKPNSYYKNDISNWGLRTYLNSSDFKIVKKDETKKKKKPSKEITLPKEPNSGGVIAVILLTFLFILINIDELLFGNDESVCFFSCCGLIAMMSMISKYSSEKAQYQDAYFQNIMAKQDKDFDKKEIPEKPSLILGFMSLILGIITIINIFDGSDDSFGIGMAFGICFLVVFIPYINMKSARNNFLKKHNLKNLK